MSDTTERLAALQAKRAERLALLAEREAEQRCVDLEAIMAIEDEHGPTNMAAVKVPWTRDGLVCMVAVRTASANEVKRFQGMIKPRRDGSPGDAGAAHELTGRACLVYPSKEAFAELCAARPGLAFQAGYQALKLAEGRAEEDTKG